MTGFIILIGENNCDSSAANMGRRCMLIKKLNIEVLKDAD